MAAEGYRIGRGGPRQIPSMGPRPDGRGRPDILILHISNDVLQWGRDRMAAEGDVAVSTRLAAADPSMGPRPDGRGRPWAKCRNCSVWTFNGAATGWPRKARWAAARSWSAPRLQWGRDRMAAEGSLAAFTSSASCLPSMGPRPDGRGRIFMAVAGSVQDSSLQWGRDRMAAEGRRGAEPAVSVASLQWGRDRMAAEGAPCPSGIRPAACSFNGAATGWPRKVALHALAPRRA